jgi:hypothetical protein
MRGDLSTNLGVQLLSVSSIHDLLVGHQLNVLLLQIMCSQKIYGGVVIRLLQIMCTENYV